MHLIPDSAYYYYHYECLQRQPNLGHSFVSEDTENNGNMLGSNKYTDKKGF